MARWNQRYWVLDESGPRIGTEQMLAQGHQRRVEPVSSALEKSIANLMNNNWKIESLRPKFPQRRRAQGSKNWANHINQRWSKSQQGMIFLAMLAKR
jgi:hypothetical protein